MINKLKINEFYRLKSSPEYGWIKVLEIQKPHTPANKNAFIIIKAEHTVSKGDTVGFIRLFRLNEIIIN